MHRLIPCLSTLTTLYQLLLLLAAISTPPPPPAHQVCQPVLDYAVSGRVRQLGVQLHTHTPSPTLCGGSDEDTAASVRQ